MLYPFPPAYGASSPWGLIQSVTPLGPDAAVVTTASHGGIRISPPALDRLPEPLRKTAYSGGGWFEEDCDWVLPYLALRLHTFELDPAEGVRRRADAVRTMWAFHARRAALLGLAGEVGGPADV